MSNDDPEGLFIDQFVEKYGITATVTHLRDFVTHTRPNDQGDMVEVHDRQWVVVYEHPDVFWGDQCIIALPYTTEVFVSAEKFDTTDALLTIVSRASEGALTFEQYVERYFHYGPVGHNKIAVEEWAHPVSLSGDWHDAAGLRHRLRQWCSSPAMRNDLDRIATPGDAPPSIHVCGPVVSGQHRLTELISEQPVLDRTDTPDEGRGQ